MRVSVDADKCQGHLRCILYAPDVFEADYLGHATAIVDDVPADLAPGARRAAENCPERAITIDD